MENSKIHFILASSSPRRKELLGHLKVPLTIKALDIPEISNATDPIEYCREIAKLKGSAVFEHLRTVNAASSLFVVSADTIVCFQGKIYGKPRDLDEARTFLNELSGHRHSVFTAVAINFVHEGKKDEFSFVEESMVTFNEISPELMKRYLSTGDSLDKAGAYGIQGASLTFISKVEGDYANVMGFPLSRFIEKSEKFFKEKFPQEGTWLNLF